MNDVATEPKISGVLTISNVARLKLARRAANQFLSQAYLPVELIIINTTGSPVLTNDGLNQAQAKDSGISVVELMHEPLPNAAAMRNAGIPHTTGEWLVFLDDDDYLHPSRLLHQMAYRNHVGSVLRCQLRIDLTEALHRAVGDTSPVAPRLYLHLNDAGVFSTAVLCRAVMQSKCGGDKWFDEQYNVGEWEVLRNQLGQELPFVCDNSRRSAFTSQPSPLLSVAMFHGTNELNSTDFFANSLDVTGGKTGLTSIEFLHLREILQSYNFVVE